MNAAEFITQLLDKIIPNVTDIFLGTLFGSLFGALFVGLISYLIWRWQKRRERIETFLKEIDIFSATNKSIDFALEYYLTMRDVLKGIEEVQRAVESGEGVHIQGFPVKYNDFECIEKSIFNTINNRKTLRIASHVFSGSKQIKHRLDSIHEKYEPVLERLVSEDKGKDSKEYKSLTSSQAREYFDKVCESFLLFSIVRFYLVCRLEVIKDLGYYKKKSIKKESSKEKEIDRKAEERMEEELRKFLKKDSGAEEAKDATLACWKELKKWIHKKN